VPATEVNDVESVNITEQARRCRSSSMMSGLLIVVYHRPTIVAFPSREMLDRLARFRSPLRISTRSGLMSLDSRLCGERLS